jgi:drug/metabolite transporter (DMT)-like permease
MTDASASAARTQRTAWFQIHFCVLLWGFTAILGKLITLGAMPLVWWRMTIVTVLLLLVPRVWRGLRGMTPKLRLGYACAGALIALHWLTFYAAVKLSNASVGVICMAMVTVMTALIEPMFTGKRISKREVALGIVALPGVLLVTDGVPAGMLVGIAVGGVSALLVAIFASLNKRLLEHADPLSVTALEMASGAVTLMLLAPLTGLILPALGGNPFELPDGRDAVLLLVLAIACTLLPFVLSLIAMRHMSAFAAQLAISLEPVYAILLAILFLGEQRELTPQFYLGVAVILGAVLVYPLLVRPKRADGAAAEPEHPELLAVSESKTLD